jgi:hypothetical protein
VREAWETAMSARGAASDRGAGSTGRAAAIFPGGGVCPRGAASASPGGGAADQRERHCDGDGDRAHPHRGYEDICCGAVAPMCPMYGNRSAPNTAKQAPRLQSAVSPKPGWLDRLKVHPQSAGEPPSTSKVLVFVAVLWVESQCEPGKQRFGAHRRGRAEP